MKTLPPSLLTNKRHYLFYGLFVSALAHAAVFSSIDHWWPDSPTKAIPVSLSLQTLVVNAETGNDSPAVRKPEIQRKPKPPKATAIKKTENNSKLKTRQPLMAAKTARPKKLATKKKPILKTKAPQAVTPLAQGPIKPPINKAVPRQIAKTIEKPPVQLVKPQTQPANSGYLAPQPISELNKPPKYPAKAKRQGLEGHLLISAVISLEGKIADISVKKSSGHRLFDRAAIKAIAKWKFHAASRHGIKEVASIELPIRFQLN